MKVITCDMVVSLLGIEVYSVSGSENYIVCPACGRKDRKCSFNSSKGKDIDGTPTGAWQCFACGAHGNGVGLYMAERGMGDSDEAYKEAVNEILGDTRAEFEAKAYVPKPKEEAKKASAEDISKAYGIMLLNLGLKEEHKADLLKRGLTENEVRGFGFRSSPDNGYELVRRMISKTKEPVALKGVPGFYKGAYDNTTCAGVKKSGYFCPAFIPTEGGSYLCRGFQKRLDHPEGGNKYIWFSSKDRKDGCGSGALCTVLKGAKPGIVIITEGVLKATVTYCLLKHQITVIGVPGVKSLGDLKNLLKDGIISKSDVVFECFDMDKEQMSEEAKKREYLRRDEKYKGFSFEEYSAHLDSKASQIRQDQKKLLDLVKPYCSRVIPVHWDFSRQQNTQDGYIWNGEFKGIDDMLLKDNAPKAFYRWLIKKATEK